MQARRIASGGRIDRTQPLNFTFNGKRYQGFLGDTLASALLANGVHFVARSFKYHRPRGILSAGVEEPNALVQLEEGAYTEPNVRATQVELYDGLRASSVNAWPNLRLDCAAINNAFGRFFVAGFYYEPFLRRVAGMGKSPLFPDPDLYDRTYRHCDVLVAGGGPAGIAAALAAGRAGARVILADEQNEFGGRLLSSNDSIEERAAIDWVGEAIAELAAMPEVTLLPRTTVFGYHDHNYLTLLERRTDHLGPGATPGRSRQRVWHVRAKEVVLATGAHERPLVFNGNDRPGVMLAGAVETYIRRYAVRPGNRAVLFTNNDSAYETALALADSGVDVSAIIDVRQRVRSALPEKARTRGIQIFEGHAVVATEGSRHVKAVEIMAREGEGVGGRRQRIECDLVAMSGGWNPTVHLFSQSRGRLAFDEEIAAFIPEQSAQRERSAGAARGRFALHDCVAEGFASGTAAAAAVGHGAGIPTRAPAIEAIKGQALEPVWVVPTDPTARRSKIKAFVDFQNDVTVADIELAVQEGFDRIEHAKRYTTAGMGTDQGKTGNIAALAILSKATGHTIAETGTTTFRAPYTPVTFGALAGREHAELADPVRVTPMHPWHVQAGAAFEDVGQWKRPRYYPRGGEDMDAAVHRECRDVRASLGVQDVSTLGKIDASGRDVAKFLDRIYTNAFSNLGINRCRYGLMCGDDGMVFDDGVVTRIADDYFYLTTTTGGAARVLERLEEWLQTEWPDLEVHLTSVTDQWAAAAIAGPRSREMLGLLAPELPLDNSSFPLMAMRTATVAGLPARVFRVSFSGELAYEINVPARWGLTLWQSIMDAGAKFDITPYGTETMHVLRAEKGFIIVGQETDGTTTPFDLGMDWIVSGKKKDFIGKRSLSRPDCVRQNRKQLVGLLPNDPSVVLPEGTQLTDVGRHGRQSVLSNRKVDSMRALGHVTSSYWSPNLGRSFALALVEAGRQRIASSVFAQLETGPLAAKVVAPQFFDKEGQRQHG
jgi:sarcosine oxidase subunit alpha